MIEYVAAPKLFYDEFFKDIVGVSHMKDARKEHIVIRARSLYIFKLMDTNHVHKSYTVVKPYAQYKDGSMQSSLFTLSQTTSSLGAFFRWVLDWRLFHQNQFEIKWLNECKI